MIALNIFAPTQADKVLATFCKTVDIDKDFLSKNLKQLLKLPLIQLLKLEILLTTQ